ncbi:SulP family inorganic anion transporter [Streptomyces sp. NPDC090131]|uniref:SulP family inorganic anion transporter n=1 Tax=Streptomyces sp. NPDC090131 TaxID=3365954 RepID=UPI0037F680E2
MNLRPASWPVLTSLRGYRRVWLRRDVLAGLTVAAIAIPAQMATATLAGFPVQARPHPH